MPIVVKQMFDIKNDLNLEAEGLILQGNHLNITKSSEQSILIQQDIKITVCTGVTAKIVDITNQGSIEVVVEQNAILHYQVLNSSNTHRLIQCAGTVDVLEISLHPTTESITIFLNEPEANASISLLAIDAKEKQRHNQSIIHNAPHTDSNISNFGVAMNGADIVFDTTGKITQGMSKSVCKQLSKGIVMDDASSVVSKPILLIDEYDVVANHGASIGKMSDESLFYLMSRGLTKTEAFLLILEGIIAPFINAVQDDKLKESINDEIRKMIER